MTWQLHQEGLILDGDRLVGSMMPDKGRWRVEIMWSGPGGDIVYETEVHAAALAFIIGVEKTVAAYNHIVNRQFDQLLKATK